MNGPYLLLLPTNSGGPAAQPSKQRDQVMSSALNTVDLCDIDAELSNQSPQNILRYALENHSNIAISFSGAEDVVLIDMAYKIRPDIQVFSLDTWRLHAET